MERPLKALRYPLVAVTAALIGACGQAPEATEAAMPAPTVSVAEVIEQRVTEWDELTGRLEAPESVEIRPRVSGFIDKVAFDEGALVKKGDLLFQIDPRPFEAQVKRLQAELQQARATERRTASEAERGERLRANNAISAELADARVSAASEAKSAVAAIQAQLDAAKLDLAFTRVTAPIDGRVGSALITAGNLVNAGEALLTTLVSTDKVYAYFEADERTYLKYRELARNGTRGAETPVYLGLSSEDGHPHLGHMNFIDNHVDPRTGTIRGRAVFDNRDGSFTPGLYARLKLVGSATYDAVLIKDVAVGTDLGKKFVLVLGDDGKVNYRSIELGPKLEGMRIVRKGLEQGETIVVNGLQRVRPGTAVEPQQVPMADADTLAALKEKQRAVTAAFKTEVVDRSVTRRPSS
ncbi:efflux RND transporter periplasmic adaptor subunit [Stutzerimonas zhaodongensis]|uniref:Efflux RND transporter periplasmic adaptor subunit n=1 Tax=Stutzerimonas zhaodongensis TaxID=1176257 RepID=A0A3M2HHF3_9GAMM|nr:efflux RND transporter periplasmic adaptor subunit [Stutzerimonas zhaodongensis]MCQ4316047.1 efflux RND transporter periplasmic adaptor subunit [Stutzerimonas zhaodongensis]RMH89146.1 efflux RND transporter periplasmic adaptor subunit [Stutzerimonas zhaodongensis]